MLSRRLVALITVSLIGFIALTWIVSDSGQAMSAVLGSHPDVRATPAIDAARRLAIYGPWGMFVLSAIVLAGILVDVHASQTKALQAQSELQRAVRQEHAACQGAQEADHRKDQFLATVSHELRTPLTSILGWCGLLAGDDARQTLLDEGLASIAQAARVQSRLVDDLLDVSRIIAGKLVPDLEDVDAVEVIDNAIASVAPAARTKGVAIVRSVEGRPRQFRADATRLEQILWNLLSNAIRFTPPDGSITVALRWSDSKLTVIVADTGAGIDPELMPYIFDPFRQGHTNGTRKGGLGLGLSIVKSLVDLHGGEVRAQSSGSGSGATFIVEFPLLPGNDAESLSMLEPAADERTQDSAPATNLVQVT
jgi:signal transduction histidine kinase